MGDTAYRLFTGLWMMADRKGRLKDEPGRIEAQAFPFKFQVIDIEALLNSLAGGEDPFIERYEVNGQRFIQILNFSDHQRPHPREAASEIPPSRAKAQPRHGLGMSKDTPFPSSSLIPSSLIPGSSDSNIPASPVCVNGDTKKPKPETDLQKIVKAWKIISGVPESEWPAWDRVHFSRNAKSAKSLLELFGTWEKAVDCIEYVHTNLKRKKLDCTLETCVKRSDLFREKEAKWSSN